MSNSPPHATAMRLIPKLQCHFIAAHRDQFKSGEKLLPFLEKCGKVALLDEKDTLKKIITNSLYKTLTFPNPGEYTPYSIGNEGMV